MMHVICKYFLVSVLTIFLDIRYFPKDAFLEKIPPKLVSHFGLVQGRMG